MNKAQDSKLSIKGVLVLCRGITVVLLVVSLFILISSGLGDFLRAPIGFKGSVSDSSGIVGIARMALWPLLIGFWSIALILWFTDDLSEKMLRKVLGIGALSLAGLFSGVAFLISSPGRAVVTLGTHLLLAVLPYLIAGCLLWADCHYAYLAVANWRRSDSVRIKVVRLLICISAVSGTCGFIAVCIPSANRVGFVVLFSLVAIFTFFGGALLNPKIAMAPIGHDEVAKNA